MKQLLLFANTSIQDLETAMSKAQKIIFAKDNYPIQIELVTNRENTQLPSADFVICIGIPVWEVNRNFIGPQAVVCLLADPMNLSALHGKRVQSVDYILTEDAYDYTLKNLSLDDLCAILIKSYKQKPGKDRVQIKELDMVPKILAAIPDRPSFLQQFSAIIYSVQGDDIRNSIRSTFMKWIVSDEDPQILQNKLITVLGYKRPSKRTKELSEFFETSDGQKVRKAVRMVLEMAARNQNIKRPRAIKFAAVAAEYHASQYDLKYMAHIAKRDGLLTHVWVEILNKKIYNKNHEQWLEPEDAKDVDVKAS